MSDISVRIIRNAEVIVVFMVSGGLAVLVGNGAGLLHGMWSLLIGFVLFRLGVCGAGDVKLLTALSLAIGSQWWLPCLILMLFLGGIAAFILLLASFVLNKPMLRQAGVPYGVPISVAGWLAVTLTQIK
jgi:prepilin peptidase CpaA